MTSDAVMGPLEVTSKSLISMPMDVENNIPNMRSNLILKVRIIVLLHRFLCLAANQFLAP